MVERGRPRSFDRDEALRRAMEVFWARGYDGASISELTAAMGINSPSLYAAFGSKEGLFREAVAVYASTVNPEIWTSIPEAATAREAIAGFLAATARAFAGNGQPRGCLIVLGALHPTGGNATVCDVLREHRAENVGTLRARLERGVEEGELPEGLDCEAAARFFATVQQGMSIQARDGASREALMAVAECAMAAWDGLVQRA